MMSKKHFLLSLSSLIILFFPVNTLSQQRLKKKIVEYGWDVPYPDFVRDNIREMEKRPFDGIIFRTSGFDHIFDSDVLFFRMDRFGSHSDHDRLNAFFVIARGIGPSTGGQNSWLQPHKANGFLRNSDSPGVF